MILLVNKQSKRANLCLECAKIRLAAGLRWRPTSKGRERRGGGRRDIILIEGGKEVNNNLATFFCYFCGRPSRNPMMVAANLLVTERIVNASNHSPESILITSNHKEGRGGAYF